MKQVLPAIMLLIPLVAAPAYAASQATSPAQLSGRVVEDRTGAPISRAYVLLVPQARAPLETVPQTITDLDGRYTFFDVAPGRYRVDIQKTGILPLADAAKAPTVTLAPGQVIDDWNVSVQMGGAIVGRILDPFGEPLVDVTVSAVPRNRSDTVPQTTANDSLAGAIRALGISTSDLKGVPTNDLGEFRVFGLSPGEYMINATPQQRLGIQNIAADSTLLASTFYPGVSDASAAQPIAVTAGETVGGVEFRLLATPGFSVSGVVVDQAGVPAAGRKVMLRGEPRFDLRGVVIMGPGSQSTSDASGRFVFGNIPSGSYYAIVLPLSNNPNADPMTVTVNDADIEDLRIVLQF